jgi:hypothetical protein
MRVGHFTINTVVEFQVLEGSRVKHRSNDLDAAITWAEEEVEAEREREEIAQFGPSGIGSDKADREWKERHEEPAI